MRVGGEAGPYIVVGEGSSAAELVDFARKYPDSVASLLLIDPITDAAVSTADGIYAHYLQQVTHFSAFID